MIFPWIKRPDLIAVPHDSGGWVVKDPLTLHYTLLDDAEYAVLQLLDGRRRFAELLNDAIAACPHAGITAQDLADFIRSLAGHQLIRQVSGGDFVRLSPDHVTSHPLKYVGPLFRILRLQLNLLNPARLIDRLMPIVSVFFTGAVIRFFLLTGAAALAILVLRFGDVVRSLPTVQEFLGPQNLMLMLAVFVAVKVLHEAGHAFTARYFGAECNECGVMLMVFTPVLYTNVSDSWLLPRHQRLLVTGAGILVELAIASVCTLLWWSAAPGVTRSILLNTMLLCSVNTLLFNGNPLLRFDGYFLLADWIRVPNLASQSAGLLKNSLAQLITGRRRESYSGRHRRFLLIYGILSAAYRFVLTIAILGLVDEMARQWHVQFAGAFVSAIILTGFVLAPALTFVQSLKIENGREPFTMRTRVRGFAFAGLLALMLLFPLPQSIVAPAFVQPASETVFAALPGKLVSHMMYGAVADRDESLAMLQNPELQQTEQELRARSAEVRQQLDSLLSSPATAGSEIIPALRNSLRAAENRSAAFTAEYAGLSIRSPARGVFLPPPAVSRENRADLPQLWDGLVAASANVGAWIERGTVIGHVGAADDLRLLVCIQEDDVEFVKAGQTVFYLTSAGASGERKGVVETLSQIEATQLPAQLGIAGMVSGTMTPDGFTPSVVTFLATVKLDVDSGLPPPALYSTGRTRISVAPSPLLFRLVRYLRQTF